MMAFIWRNQSGAVLAARECRVCVTESGHGQCHAVKTAGQGFAFGGQSVKFAATAIESIGQDHTGGIIGIVESRQSISHGSQAVGQIGIHLDGRRL